MTAKREHTLAAVAADDASAARIVIPKPISVHLTPFAPEMASRPMGDRQRWRTFYGRTARSVTKGLLTKLQLRPDQVRVAAGPAPGDVDVLGPVPPEKLGLVSRQPGELVPFATFWDGVTEPELADVIAQLAAERWAPDLVRDLSP